MRARKCRACTGLGRLLQDEKLPRSGPAINDGVGERRIGIAVLPSLSDEGAGLSTYATHL
jgi:hypothetical protein